MFRNKTKLVLSAVCALVETCIGLKVYEVVTVSNSSETFFTSQWNVKGYLIKDFVIGIQSVVSVFKQTLKPQGHFYHVYCIFKTVILKKHYVIVYIWLFTILVFSIDVGCWSRVFSRFL